MFTLLKGRYGSFPAPFDTILLIGTAGAIAFSLPAALLTLVLTLLLRISGLYSCRSFVVVGAALGACFAGRVFLNTSETVQASLAGAFSGAICGWIYWQIAKLRRGTLSDDGLQNSHGSSH